MHDLHILMIGMRNSYGVSIRRGLYEGDGGFLKPLAGLEYKNQLHVRFHLPTPPLDGLRSLLSSMHAFTIFGGVKCPSDVHGVLEFPTAKGGS